MRIEVGQVEAILRYPVKSMGGEPLEVAHLGWHGLDEDRRLALRRIDDRSGFPWLTASKLSDLLLYAPHRHEDGAQGDLPTHVRTPDGDDLPAFGEDLATEIGRRDGAPVQMMRLDHGIFGEARTRDDAPALTVTMRDARCSMVNLDPDSAHPAPEVLKAVVRANQNNAGVYGVVTRICRLTVGQTMFLHTPGPGTPPGPIIN